MVAVQSCVVLKLAFSGRCLIDVVCVTCLDFFEVVIRYLCHFEPTGLGIDEVHTGEAKINFFDCPPYFSMFDFDCI